MSSTSNPMRADDPLVGVDLGEVERFSLDRRDADSTEREALSAGRNSGRRYLVAVDHDVGEGLQVCEFGISALPDAAFTTRRRSSVTTSSANIAAIAFQSRAAKYVR